MSYGQRMRRVILPQAFRRMVPPLVGQSIIQMKNTTLLSAITVPDLLYQGSYISSFTYKPMEIYTAVGAIFLIILVPLDDARAPLERGQWPSAWRSRQVGDGRPRPSPPRASACASEDRQVLKGSTFRCKPGEVVVLIGASGSGKTSLLRCINLLNHAGRAGRSPIDGAAAYSTQRPRPDRSGCGQGRVNRIRAKTGMVFQQFNLFPHLTALENCHRRRRCIVRAHAAAEAEARAPLALLDRVGLARQGRCLAGAALGRPAAARRDRPRARHGADR